MKRLVRCEYTDLFTGESWVRVFLFDAGSGKRIGAATKQEIEAAPLPDRVRPDWEGDGQ